MRLVAARARGGRGFCTARAAMVACAVALAGSCSTNEQPEARVGLKVPLPDGWVAQPAGAGALRIGPKGRVALTVEHRTTGTLPEPAAVKSVLEAEGAVAVSALALPDGWLFRYDVGSETQALVGARSLANGLVLCASEPRATLDEVKQSAQLCAAIAAPPR